MLWELNNKWWWMVSTTHPALKISEIANPRIAETGFTELLQKRITFRKTQIKHTVL